jgi:addiction module RelE/StbE family toxin
MKKSLAKINYSRTFNKQLKKAPLKVMKAFKERRRLFIDDPFHPKLNNHMLRGKYAGYRSINITGDWRALYTEHRTYHEKAAKKAIVFELLGTHSQLYK